MVGTLERRVLVLDDGRELRRQGVEDLVDMGQQGRAVVWQGTIRSPGGRTGSGS
jgi:hypothetical protein